MSELPDVEFAAIYDADPATAAEIGGRLGVHAVSSLEEFASLVDAATIATPTPTHFPVAKFLLEKGKHCLVEKPITENTRDATELADLAQSSGLVLQVGHIERFNPVLSALESRLSCPQFIESHRLSPYPNRSIEIGVVLDLMIHDIEIVLHLVRSPVKYVDAVGIAVLSRGEDIANARIRFENGCVANLTASRISPERMRKIRVFQKMPISRSTTRRRPGKSTGLRTARSRARPWRSKKTSRSSANSPRLWNVRARERSPKSPATKGRRRWNWRSRSPSKSKRQRFDSFLFS